MLALLPLSGGVVHAQPSDMTFFCYSFAIK
jgi:hypothetical protein